MPIESIAIPRLVGLESSFGVPSTPAMYLVSYVTDDVGGSRNLITAGNLRGDYSHSAPRRGRKTAGGNWSFEPNLKSFPFWIKALCGNLTQSGSTPNFIYTGKVGPNAPAPICLEKQIGASHNFRTVGGIVNTFATDIQVDGFLKADLGIVAKKTTIETTALDASPGDWRDDESTNPTFDHSQIATSDFLIDGSQDARLSQVRINIDRKVQSDDYRIAQDMTIASAVPGPAEITGSLMFKIDDEGDVDDVCAGGLSSFYAKWTQSTHCYCAINLPAITLSEKFASNSNGILMCEVQFQAHYDSGIGAMAALIVANQEVAGAYAHP